MRSSTFRPTVSLDALLAQGTVLGTRVGLHAERSLEFVAGMLGILKAGAGVRAIGSAPACGPAGRTN